MDACGRIVSLERCPLSLLLILAAVSTSLPASAQCTPRWVEEFPGGDLEGGSPQAFTIFDDDGAGPNLPALFAGGWFTLAGGSPTRVAKWDGTKWSPLAVPVASTVYALTGFDDDGPGPDPSALYVAGAFPGHIGKWNGFTWSVLAGGTNGDVFSLAVFDDDGPGPNNPGLFAGGTFTSAGGVAAHNVAKWDGATWTPLAGGVGQIVRAMTLFDPDASGPAASELVVGGDFAAASGVVALHVARWNGSSWSALGNGTDGSVHALHVFDGDGGGPEAPALYAGGDFLAAGGAPASRIARWNGASWSALGQGLNDVVDSLAGFDPDGSGILAPALFAGGDFTAAGSVAAKHVARWDGASWTALSDGFGYIPEPSDPNTAPHVYAMAEFDPDAGGPSPDALYAGGIFTSAGDDVARNFAAWDGSAWSALGNGMNGVVLASTVFDDDGPGPHPPALIVGGDFTGAGGRSANRIAMWDGSSWSNLRAGMDDTVRALCVFDGDGAGGVPPALYAGGDFSNAGGVASGIASWNGSSWEPLSTGVYGSVYCLAVFDDDGNGPGKPELFVGGAFTSTAGTNASRIAKWDGSAWSEVGGGIGGTDPIVRTMAVFDDDGPGPGPSALYAAGSFATAGGLSCPSIAKWNGTSWSALSGGPDGLGIYALAVHDEDGPGPGLPALFAGGSFQTVGGAFASNIARWNGTSWSSLDFGVDSAARALAVFDADGLGPNLPELYVGGEFAFAGGVLSRCIAKWSGTQWSPLSVGIGPPFSSGVMTLAVFDEDGSGPNPTSLYVGGDFGTAGGFSSAFIARRQGCGSSVGSFCAGDGAAAACPCGNSGGPGRGCQNSIGSGGAFLTETGHAGLTGDTWQLTSSGELASSLSIFLQGNAAIAPAAFGDGLRCVGGSLKRLFTKGAFGGVAMAPSGVEPTVSMRSAERGDPLVAGAARHYQTYYRDANPSFCAAPVGSTFNISNGISAVWGP